MLEESVMSGTTRPQMVSRPIRGEADYRIYEYISERAASVSHSDQLGGE